MRAGVILGIKDGKVSTTYLLSPAVIDRLMYFKGVFEMEIGVVFDALGHVGVG